MPSQSWNAPVSRDAVRFGLVVVLAIAMRLWFIVQGNVANPIVGDAVQYCVYAVNLVKSATFSMAQTPPISPDSFRDPGYPFFLSLPMQIWGFSDSWYKAVLVLQAVLGSLTAGLSYLVVRRWLGTGTAFGTGLAVAVWPHSVSLTGFLLSETLFGFTLMLAIWLTARALESTKRGPWALTGLAFGAAALTNATVTPFALLLALWLFIKRVAPRQLLLVMLVTFLVVPGSWLIRGLTLPPGSSATGRAMMNLVQGSWPEYHYAWVASHWEGHPDSEPARGVMQKIDAEIVDATRSPQQGLREIFARFREEPLRYLQWYAWKPGLLWAWSIRIGIGDIYPYRIDHPIYKTYAVLRALESLCVALTPLLFVLMAGMVIAALGRRSAPPALQAVALLLLFETAVYVALQSEPRYSIPLRPLQMILVSTSIAWLASAWQRYRGARAKPVAAAS